MTHSCKEVVGASPGLVWGPGSIVLSLRRPELTAQRRKNKTLSQQRTSQEPRMATTEAGQWAHWDGAIPHLLNWATREYMMSEEGPVDSVVIIRQKQGSVSSPDSNQESWPTQGQDYKEVHLQHSSHRSWRPWPECKWSPCGHELWVWVMDPGGAGQG